MKELAERHGRDSIVVVLGLNELENLRIMATTFKEGDPSYAGALAGIALGLKSYHILELKEAIPPGVWEEELSMEELEVEDDQLAAIRSTLGEIRGD